MVVEIWNIQLSKCEVHKIIIYFRVSQNKGCISLLIIRRSLKCSLLVLYSEAQKPQSHNDFGTKKISSFYADKTTEVVSKYDD